MIKPTVGFLLVALALAGCAVHVTPPSQYLLSYPEVGNVALAGGANAQSLVIAAVDVAAFLDTSGIVLQTADHQISVASQHRWGEPLERQLRRSLYATLVKRLQQTAVFEWPAAIGSAASLKVAVDAFQGRSTGDVLITGSWRLANRAGKIIARRHFRISRPLPSDGYDALVTALSQGWRALTVRMAQQISQALRAR